MTTRDARKMKPIALRMRICTDRVNRTYEAQVIMRVIGIVILVVGLLWFLGCGGLGIFGAFFGVVAGLFGVLAGAFAGLAGTVFGIMGGFLGLLMPVLAVVMIATGVVWLLSQA